MIALVATLLLQNPGDRVFARDGALLRRAPALTAEVVWQLRPGDELVELDPPEDELTGKRPPAGFRLVQTVDVPSGRTHDGWAIDRELNPEPLPDPRRIGVLHQSIGRSLSELEGRVGPFADLRAQMAVWRKKAGSDPTALPQLKAVADQLARYMELEIVPRAMDIEDGCAELKELQDPKLAPLQARFSRLAPHFQP